MFTVLVYCLLSLSNWNCKSHSTLKNNVPIKISFVIDGKNVSISNGFALKFINGTDTLLGQITDTMMQIPALKDTAYDVLFKYASHMLFFPHVLTSTMIPNQKMKWIFGIQNRPFSLESGLLSKTDFESDTTTKYLVYWQFDPEEFGDGIQIVQKKAN